MSVIYDEPSADSDTVADRNRVGRAYAFEPEFSFYFADDFASVIGYDRILAACVSYNESVHFFCSGK